MGIQLLNTFLKKRQCDGIKEISLKDLAGKKIVVDISIYLYRYKQQDALIENIFQLCSILRYYNIHPIFIFDGKSPIEKKKTLEERSKRRKDAAILLLKYQEQLQNTHIVEKHKLYSKIKLLKKKIVKLSLEDFSNVKQLLNLYGMTWIQAKGEADELCAALVKSNMAYACLSEDTDMFVLGIPRVIKYFSLIHHTCVMYDVDIILTNLNIEEKDFRHLCIIAGTDYNSQIGNIFTFYEHYTEFKQTKETTNFLHWLCGKYISTQNYYKIQNINLLYAINTSEILQQYKYILIKNGIIQMESLKEFLKTQNFIFC